MRDKTCACGHSIIRHQHCGRGCEATGCHDCVCDIRAFEVDQGVLQYHHTDPLFCSVSLEDRVAELRRGDLAEPSHACAGRPAPVGGLR